MIDQASYEPSAVNYEKLRPYLKGGTGLSDEQQSKAVPNHHAVSSWPLSEDELAEIADGLRYFESGHHPLSAISPATFPLTTLSSKLGRLSQQLEHSQEYCLLSGLDPGRYSDEQNIIIQAGICSHVGIKRGMAGGEGGDKNVIHHITPLPTPVVDKASDVYHGPPNTSVAMPFHNDVGQIVSLYTVVASSRGGRFYLARTSEIVEKIRACRPDLLTVLQEPWTMISPTSESIQGETRPLLFLSEGRKPIISCSRARITGTPTRPRPSFLPPLTPAQSLALDALHYVGQSAAIPFDFQPGDLLFFNNLTTMHARDRFFGGAKPVRRRARQRHLTRLIVRDERTPWYIPEKLERQMKACYEHKVEDEEFQIEKTLFLWEASH